MAREQRLVFGEVADLYDRFRPEYPERLIDDVVRLAGVNGERPVLEVGSGTGKATRMFAARGIPVIGVEPSAEMAAVARHTLDGRAAVIIEQSDFEHWDPAGRCFPLLFSAQAWHWVSPQAGFTKARQVLEPGGLIAAFWNRPDWTAAPLRAEMLELYRDAVPGMSTNSPMHPANAEVFTEEPWAEEIEAAPGLGAPELRRYDWVARYTAGEYAGLLATISEVRMLPEDTREALLAALREFIESRGGALELPMLTRLCLARRVD